MSGMVRIHRRALLGTIVMFLVSGTASALAGSVPWRSGAADIPRLEPAQIETSLRSLATDARGASVRRIVVQFDRPVDDALRNRLAAGGMQLLSYVGENTFFASLATERADTAALANVAGLVGVTDVQPAWKLHPFLNNGGTPKWAQVGNTSDGTPIIGAYVLFHPDVDLEAEGVAIAQGYGANVRDVLESINGLVIELPQDVTLVLAGDDAVQWVEPALPRFGTNNNSNRGRVQADQVQVLPYNLDGSGVTVLVYDAATARASHQDFGGRLTVRDGSGLDDHPTHVAGTIGGSGAASGGTYKGMAPGVIMESYGYEWDSSGVFLYNNPGDLESDYTQAINTHGADIANNSIGTNTALYWGLRDHRRLWHYFRPHR